MYSSVKDLPESIRLALGSLGYNKADIFIEAKESVDISSCAGDGMRGFYAIVALDGSVDSEIRYGSWGGQNMFETKRVDVDNSQHVIPVGVAVITGSSGGRGCFARITLNPTNMAALLPIKADITQRQKDILESYVSLKPAYRPKYPAEEITELVNKGMLKQNKAGATQITTAGKNAARG